jgi:hypothetical protein
MEQILLLAGGEAPHRPTLTSENLTELDFLAEVSPGAQKRLTELYARRLLAFDENPRHPKERLFTLCGGFPTVSTAGL